MAPELVFQGLFLRVIRDRELDLQLFLLSGAVLMLARTRLRSPPLPTLPRLARGDRTAYVTVDINWPWWIPDCRATSEAIAAGSIAAATAPSKLSRLHPRDHLDLAAIDMWSRVASALNVFAGSFPTRARRG
jgi:hypothetical protein